MQHPFRVRVTTGQRAAQAVDGLLQTLFHSSGLRVEGTGQVSRVELGGGRLAFLAGEVTGPRAAGAAPGPSGLPALKDLLADEGDLGSKLEGRFVLVRIGPDGACRIRLDRFGRADVYYDGRGADCTLATDLGLLHGPASGGFDQAAWIHALAVYGYRPPKRHKLYAGIRRLGVGQIACVSGGRVSLETVPFEPIRAGQVGERELGQYADRLLEAVRALGSPNGNVVYLSSGWDSTSLLACLVHLFGKRRVRAVIGRMIYAERSGVINQFEIDRARAVADYFGVRLDVVDFDYRRNARAHLDRVRPLFRDHHLASVTGINHAVLADFTARTSPGDEVVFAGEISDGAHNLGFAQFVTIFHPVPAFREYADKMASYLFGPTFLGLLQREEHEQDAVYGFLRGRLGDARLDAPSPDGAAARTRQLLASFFLRGGRFPLFSLGNSRVPTEEGAARYAHEMEEAYLADAARACSHDTLYAWYLHLYNSFHWQGSTVATLALTAEARGLRAALPFWDAGVQDSLAALPEEAGRGLDLNPTKYPLKWTLRNRLDYPFHLQVGPHSYLYDVDPSFSHSAELAYGSSFAPVFREVLGSKRYHDVLDPGLVDVIYLDAIVDRYLGGIEVRGAELSDLLALATIAAIGWYES